MQLFMQLFYVLFRLIDNRLDGMISFYNLNTSKPVSYTHLQKISLLMQSKSKRLAQRIAIAQLVRPQRQFYKRRMNSSNKKQGNRRNTKKEHQTEMIGVLFVFNVSAGKSHSNCEVSRLAIQVSAILP